MKKIITTFLIVSTLFLSASAAKAGISRYTSSNLTKLSAGTVSGMGGPWTPGYGVGTVSGMGGPWMIF